MPPIFLISLATFLASSISISFIKTEAPDLARDKQCPRPIPLPPPVTIADLLPLPRGELKARFGGFLLKRLDQILDQAPEMIVPVRSAPDFEVEWCFECPTSHHNSIQLSPYMVAGLKIPGTEDVVAGAERLCNGLIVFLLEPQLGYWVWSLKKD